MKILGITHPISSNTGAALLIDGHLVSAVEEERYLRIKHAPFKLPLDSINFVLQNSKLTFSDIDYIAIGFSKVGKIFFSRLFQLISSKNLHEIPSLYLRWMRWITLQKKFNNLPNTDTPMYFVRHHVAHAASAFYASGFKEASIITLDGSGGEESGCIFFGKDNKISLVSRITDDQSWGMAWEKITNHLGFRAHSSEGKVMGLASYGRPSIESMDFIDWNSPIPKIQKNKFVNYLSEIPIRCRDGIILQEHKDLAASIQLATELAIQKIVEYAININKTRNVCFAGGVALNCATNGKMAQLSSIEKLFIQPIASDAGTAIGAALYLNTKLSKQPNTWKMKHLYYGPSFSDEEILHILNKAKIRSFKWIDDIKDIAKLIATGNIIGWHQGRMESGPRALGNRSILADPRFIEKNAQVNSIKGREAWRPLSPSILSEYLHEYIIGRIIEPDYMIIAYKATEKAKNNIPATVHIDGTIRPQSVSQETNYKYWKLIEEFRRITNIPALLNTSFNLAGEPLVCSPEDAIGTFFRSGLDYLVMGNFFNLEMIRINCKFSTKKILVCTDEYPPKVWGGMSRSLETIVETIANYGYSIDVLTHIRSSAANQLHSIYDNNAYKVFWLKYPLLSAQKMWNTLDLNSYDVFYFNGRGFALLAQYIKHNYKQKSIIYSSRSNYLF
jgi:carbamoyltransferase